MRKRGQLNIYVIIGIVIVALAVLLVYYQQSIVFSTWDLERIAAERIPKDAKEVNDYVASCLEEVASDGVEILGMQGGYINIPADNYGGRSPVNQFSNTLEILDGGMETAYWFYETPNGIQATAVPTKEIMQKQLGDYVAENIKLCTNNFTLFEVYNVTPGKISVDAEILDSRILFTVKYPLYISTADLDYLLSRFYVSIDSGLGKLYEQANGILEAESESNFLEEKTIDILTVYEDVPYTGTDTECQPKFWLLRDVEASLKDALSANIPFIKISGTDFNEREQYFVEDVSISGASGTNVQFFYSGNWPLSLEVQPSEGGVLAAEPLFTQKMEELAFVSSLVCIRDYNFIYDIKYPVLVVLTDDSGALFQFAVMAIIDNNQPRENVADVIDFESNKGKICGNRLSTQTVEAIAPDNDGIYHPVSGAEISLKCASTECEIGKTGSRGSLTAAFPQCFNALLTASKEGYHKGRELASTVEDGSLSVVMDPYYAVDVEVKMIDNGMIRLPNSNEDYIITISDEEKRFVEVISRESRRISLIAGRFDVKSQAFADSDYGITIEGTKVERCVAIPQKGILGIFGLTEEKCFSTNIPDVTLNRVIKGGADYSWELQRDAISGASKITFYIPVVSTPSTMEEIEEAYDLEETPIDLISPLVE
ncbi:MAG: hypothetical protein ABIB71_01950 [Candidatus Woesearchaeota archaeon]